MVSTGIVGFFLEKLWRMALTCVLCDRFTSSTNWRGEQEAFESRYRATTLLLNGRVDVEVCRGSSGVGAHSLKCMFVKLITSVT